MITMTQVIEAGYTNGSTTHASLPITTRTKGEAETVAPPEDITVEKNYVTNRFQLHATVMDRRVTVCSHATRWLAELCRDGKSCAYGKPVGSYKS